MFRRSYTPHGRAGFYIALHPWLQVAGFVKVGFSTSLETRLGMSAFKSCFTDEWFYHTVFECESAKEAFLLEQAVLFCLSEKRVPHRELIKAPEDEVVRIGRLVARKLNLAVVEKPLPCYSTGEQADSKEAPVSVTRHPLSVTPPTEEEEETWRCDSEAQEADIARSRATCDEADEGGMDGAVAAQQIIAPYAQILRSTKASLHRRQQTIDTDNDYLDFPTDNDLAVMALPGNPALAPRPTPARYAAAPSASAVATTTTTAAAGVAVGEQGNWQLHGETEVAPLTFIDSENYTLEQLRPYQQEAVTRIKEELRRSDRAICQMACRCGKTPVAFCIMRDVVQPDPPGQLATGRVLYLVPGLALLRQTARKLFNYGFDRVPLLLIGSDPSPVFLGTTGGSKGTETTKSMTTDPDVIQSFLLQHSHCVVISTYHSSPLLKPLANMICLTVFDECHRVCGSSEPTAFNTMLLLPSTPASKRLFLTATPTYDTPLRMSDEDLFGGVAYRYYLREGIDSGFVNRFCVRVVLGPSLNDMVPYIMEAMRHVDKMLIFCRDISHAEALYGELATLCRDATEAMESATTRQYDDVKPFSSFIAHSQMGSSQVAASLAEFSNCRRCVLLNVRLFQEGVEIPDLNAVFFAAPRYSSRDIIQSICRPLNRLPNKPISYVFLPAAMNTRYRADHPINLQNFSTLVPFTDALMDEDPTLFEYMLDPHKKSYDINVVGLRSLRLSSEKVERFVLPAIRRGVRYSCTTQSDRLHRAARLPWKVVFAEMRRIVLECHRYPKTNDAWVVGDTSVSMNLFYKYCRKGYMLYQAGAQTYLQIHQIRDLESLPEWQRYGVEGPYPWKECLRTLEAHLATHRSPPPLDVHKGGFVGLDATPFERLSGCLMHVNQCDGKRELRLSADKQRDMDSLCSRYGLKWRKRRNADGTLRKNERTFITDSYEQFKRMHSQLDKVPAFRDYVEKHFPGYPEKHVRMENLAILMDGKVPPRHEPAKRRPRKAHPEGNSKPPQQATPAGKGEDLPSHKTKRTRSGPRRARGTGGTEDAPPNRLVMCRICRTKVPVSEWLHHVSSPEHVSAMTDGDEKSRVTVV